jgi:hypothetical protein
MKLKGKVTLDMQGKCQRKWSQPGGGMLSIQLSVFQILSHVNCRFSDLPKLCSVNDDPSLYNVWLKQNSYLKIELYRFIEYCRFIVTKSYLAHGASVIYQGTGGDYQWVWGLLYIFIKQYTVNTVSWWSDSSSETDIADIIPYNKYMAFTWA